MARGVNSAPHWKRLAAATPASATIEDPVWSNLHPYVTSQASAAERRQRSLRCVQPLDETAPFELIDYGWIGEACSTDLTFNRSEKISTWLTSSNGT